ncbi:hypothetical protein K7640_20555 [Micromonospora sp. PLK6-60]|uniref:sensor histidine kinase n=1 Tax=Micromonospora sp. PLK6-60 TaxID=2873383 RepID=UPI001CA75A8B|nr:ATP-binding protein [Micromonospora sp. PLK6-60]MBY8874224.1 hypothetical protein [Micromonospora sp. PLK6-60]
MSSSLAVRSPGWRQRVARWLDPTVARWEVAAAEAPPPTRQDDPAVNLWPAICEQFALRILASAYQMGSHLAAVEADEQDPDRLERLYRVDHANTRIRRHAENLQVLLGRRVEDADRQTVAVVDVIRAATSAVEHYPRIRVGHVVDLGVVEFAADDVIRVLTELLDNATRFSPPTSSVTVSGYVTEDGGVLLRVEDLGIGIGPDQLPGLNAMLAGSPPPAALSNAANHLGLAVASHLALVHRLRVTLTNRATGGTTATVLVPAHLLCEISPTAPPAAGPPSAWPPSRPAMDGPAHQWGTQAPTQDTRRSPTVEIATVAGPDARSQFVPPAGAGVTTAPAAAQPGPAALAPDGHGTTRGGLPRRVPESVRADAAPAAPRAARPEPEIAAERAAWPDETAAFAAGITDARPATTDEGPRP